MVQRGKHEQGHRDKKLHGFWNIRGYETVDLVVKYKAWSAEDKADDRGGGQIMEELVSHVQEFGSKAKGWF